MKKIRVPKSLKMFLDSSDHQETDFWDVLDSGSAWLDTKNLNISDSFTTLEISESSEKEYQYYQNLWKQRLDAPSHLMLDQVFLAFLEQAFVRGVIQIKNQILQRKNF